MTFIAISTTRHRADIATDSLSYERCAQTLGRTTKTTTLHHIGAAVVTQGDHHFGVNATAYVAVYAENAPDFDALAAEMPAYLRDLWAQANTEQTLPDSTVYLVGYSARAESYVSVALASDHDFEPISLGAFHVTPSPLDVRPSDLELGRLTHTHPTDLDVLRSRPAPQPPQGRGQWVDLAKRVREHRALSAPVDTGLKVLVGGEVFLTRLDRNGTTTTKVHTYDDSGEEFRRLVAGTYHPQAQLGPCHCGSGFRWVECCLRSHYDQACMCQSGKTFKDCCRLTTEAGQRIA